MNFGIVSSFTMETFYSPHKIWFAEKMAVGKEVEDMLRANYEVVTTAMDVDPHVTMMTSLACISKDGTSFASITAQHTTHNSTEHWPSSLKRHDEMKTQLGVPHMFIGSVANITEQLAISDHAKRQRTIYGTMSYKPSVELEVRISKILCEEVESDRNIAGFRHGLTMHPLSSRMMVNMHKRGGNAFQSLAAHTGPLVLLNSLWQWSERADDSKAYTSYYRLMSRIENAAQEMGLWHPYKYINYAEETQDIWGGYGDYGDLRTLQRDVDPKGVFASGGLAGGVHKLNKDGWRPDETDATGWPQDKDEL